MLVVQMNHVIRARKIDLRNPDMTVKIAANPPVIGSKYVGPNIYRNAETREMWSVSMPLTDAEITIQKWMLKKLKTIKVRFVVKLLGDVKDYSYKPSPMARLLRKIYSWC